MGVIKRRVCADTHEFARADCDGIVTAGVLEMRDDLICHDQFLKSLWRKRRTILPRTYPFAARLNRGNLAVSTVHLWWIAAANSGFANREYCQYSVLKLGFTFT